MRYASLLVGTALLIVSACGGSEEARPAARDSAEQRRHDSGLGASRLPGAGGVAGALKAADSAAARRLREDSIARSP
jgi:hypothetical protein